MKVLEALKFEIFDWHLCMMGDLMHVTQPTNTLLGHILGIFFSFLISMSSLNREKTLNWAARADTLVTWKKSLEYSWSDNTFFNGHNKFATYFGLSCIEIEDFFFTVCPSVCRCKLFEISLFILRLFNLVSKFKNWKKDLSTYRLAMLESNRCAPFHWRLLNTKYIVVSIVRAADHQLRNSLFERKIPAHRNEMEKFAHYCNYIVIRKNKS